MKKSIQQFQLRRCFGDEKRAIAALNEVRQAGFDEIELCAFLTQKTPLIVRILCAMAGMGIGASGTFDWHRLISSSGLTVTAYHSDLNGILTNADEIASTAKSYGTDKVVITGVRKLDYSREAEVLALTDRLNEAGKLLFERGIQLLYHNHNCEFVECNGAASPYEMLIEHTDERFVGFELDVYWATEAGCDAVALMRKLGARLKLLHVCDRGIRPSKRMGSILKSDCVELGRGNIDLDKILAVAKELSVESVILECTRNFIDDDALKSMRISAEYLNERVK